MVSNYFKDERINVCEEIKTAGSLSFADLLIE